MVIVIKEEKYSGASTENNNKNREQTNAAQWVYFSYSIHMPHTSFEQIKITKNVYINYNMV